VSNKNKIISRHSPQKSFIESLLKNSTTALSQTDILNAAKIENIAISRATVFRFLNNNIQQSNIKKLQGLKGSSLYEWNKRKKHHHHFFCTICQSTYPIEGCGLSVSKFTLPKGFKVKSHEVQLKGTCDNCK